MIEKVKWALLLESQVSQFYLLLLNFGHKSESMINDHQTNLNIPRQTDIKLSKFYRRSFSHSRYISPNRSLR